MCWKPCNNCRPHRYLRPRRTFISSRARKIFASSSRGRGWISYGNSTPRGSWKGTGLRRTMINRSVSWAATSRVDCSAQCSIAGIVDAGGTEDNQIFASLRAVQALANLPGQIGVAQLSVTGTTQVIADYTARLTAALPQYQVRPIRQVAEAEGALLGRIRLLIVSMVLLILILTALCVLGTMAALAMERRKDVGLMKSLGGSISRIVGLFLAEVGVLGAVGGLLGTILGAALAYWMGLRVFGTAISPRWEVFPATIALMIVVTLAGALPLRMLGNVKPAEILRGE